MSQAARRETSPSPKTTVRENAAWRDGIAATGFVSRPRTRKRGTWRLSTVWRTRATGGIAPWSAASHGGAVGTRK